MKNKNIIHGYKVFNSDWSCTPAGGFKQYTCPGKFEENISLKACEKGMHFCKKAIDCFNYYSFNPRYKVAEVIAYGDIVEKGDKCCTNKLEIIREISWSELLTIVNIGDKCTGYGNVGNYNVGNYNVGSHNYSSFNIGSYNYSNFNTGSRNIDGSYNSGNRNFGSQNSGDGNQGRMNSGDWNFGHFNTGNNNNGDYNSGNQNIGDYNIGDYNIGDWNVGDFNRGDNNNGDWNNGDYNTGDWNKCDCSYGCFNTIKQKIYLFNKPSTWTYEDWIDSKAKEILDRLCSTLIDANATVWVTSDVMTEEEKIKYPKAEYTEGYLKRTESDSKINNTYTVNFLWSKLSNEEKEIITKIPNFDKSIFKEITGIDVEE